MSYYVNVRKYLCIALFTWFTFGIMLDTYGGATSYPTHEEIIDLDYIIVAGKLSWCINKSKEDGYTRMDLSRI